MTFSESDVDHVAMLARLALTDEERLQYGAQLRDILEHISVLQKIDTSQVAATARVGDVVNVWRDDVSQPSLPADVALSGATELEGEFFRVGAIQD